MEGFWFISTLALFKSGYGEAALRFAVKAADADGSGALTEAALWVALMRSASAPLTPIQRTHLRKVWRTAEKYAKPEEEAPPAEEEGGEASPPPPPPSKSDEEPKVMAESFLAALLEDEAVKSVFATEVPIPIEAPPEAPAEEEAAE